MNVIAQVLAAVAALIHVGVGVLESFFFRREWVHREFFRVPTADVPPVLLWSFNVGFYNMFLGAGTVIGLVSLHTGDVEIGRAFVLYTCASMALLGVALGVSDRLELSRPKGAGMVGAIAQTTPPLLAVLLATLA